MENRSSDLGQRLAPIRTDFSGRRLPVGRERVVALRRHPVRVNLAQLAPVYNACDYLACVCTIEPFECSIKAIESSVLWATEGKGDQDLGVHFFERKTFDEKDSASREKIEFTISTRLPCSPLSYRGEILKINWMVSLRVFLANDSEFKFEFPFRVVGSPEHV